MLIRAIFQHLRFHKVVYDRSHDGIFSEHSNRQSLLNLQVNNFESGQYLAKLWARVVSCIFDLRGT